MNVEFSKKQLLTCSVDLPNRWCTFPDQQCTSICFLQVYAGQLLLYSCSKMVQLP